MVTVNDMLKSPPPPTPPEAPIPRPQGFYNDLLEIAGLGLWVLDAAGQTSYANRAMAEMLGYSEEEFVRMPILSYVDDDGAAVFREQWARRKENAAGNYELRLRHREGADFWVLVNKIGRAHV